MRIVGYAYPWDVTEPGFVDRARHLHVDEVAVAASYHSTRAATPWGQETTAIHATSSAFYRPLATGNWGEIRPLTADWLRSSDPFGDAVAVLSGAGLAASAWIVLTHNSYLGTECPHLAVRNCFGETYPWALCPAHPAVQAYSAQVAAASTRGLTLDGAVLEACGQMGAVHQCEHEKTDGVWSPAVSRLLSICCCDTCAAAWSTPADQVRTMLRNDVRRLLADDLDQSATALPTALPSELLARRQTSTDTVRRQVLDALPAGLRTTLHGSIDPWATGALPGLTAESATAVDSVVVQCWTPGQATLDMVRTARKQLPDSTALGVYITAVAATPVPDMAGYVDALRRAGAEELHLYHLGLAGPARWRDMRTAADMALSQ